MMNPAEAAGNDLFAVALPSSWLLPISLGRKIGVSAVDDDEIMQMDRELMVQLRHAGTVADENVS